MLKKRTFLALLLAAVMIFSFVFSHPTKASPLSERQQAIQTVADNTSSNQGLISFELLIDYLRENYVDPEKIDAKKLEAAAINGILQSLDPHSSFIDAEQYREMQREMNNSAFSGVGMVITMKDKALTVVSPIEDTPAYKAGVKSGDKIIRIDGDPTYNKTLLECVKEIRGHKGTSVALTISRDGKILVITIIRDMIPLVAVKSFMLSQKIGYVKLTTFGPRSVEREMRDALDALEKKGMKAIILDLRNNPGGLLNQAIKIADLFIESGVIVSEKYSQNFADKTVRATERGTRDYPIILLINSGSASASEIVAGALQDHGRALLIGTKTFGKGSIQIIQSLRDGSALHLTIGRYYTPSGRSIQAKGITPDIEIEFKPPSEGELLLREADLQGHLEYEPDVETEAKTDSSLDPKAKKLIETDNQARLALQILESGGVFPQLQR